eukprot:maker-scaffold181_size278858-snap-gene-0.13 protein:Tk08505 transcript:maker-scaffold181_size278858-snap-gene-0.13-mRNA-1 annotation:"von willebrand factor type egf and pentraxin domain-containing protein 1-like"
MWSKGIWWVVAVLTFHGTWAACPASNLDILSPPTGLTHNVAPTESIASGMYAYYSCDETDRMYLEPNSNANGLFGVMCGTDDSFVVPSPWPVCSKKCHIPGAQNGYKAQPANTPMASVGSTLSYKCLDQVAMVEGINSNMIQVTCGADGTFPAHNWPPCKVMCLVPSAKTGYADNGATDPVSVGDTLTYTCENPEHTVGDTSTTDHVITCGSNGQFPKSWPTCGLKCQVPANEATYGSNTLTNTFVPVGEKVKFNCEEKGHTVGDTMMAYHTITCKDDGSFDSGWPACSQKCSVPKDALGYQNQPGNTPPMAVGSTLTYTCMSSGFTTGPNMENTHDVTCNADGSISPPVWPTCNMRCPIPEPSLGYTALEPGTEAPLVGGSLYFSCSDLGARVGNSTSNQHRVVCLSNGMYDMEWPECSIRCVPPFGEAGYNSQPAGTPTIVPGESLTYHCMETGALVGDTASSAHTITCGSDGTFPSGWPACQVRCIVPEPQNGYNDPTPAAESVNVGETLTYECSEAGAEIRATQTNQLVITCGSDGSLLSLWPSCVVPLTCPAAIEPPAESELTLKAGSPDPVKAHRTLEYECPVGKTTERGPIVTLKCLFDGTYEAKETWPSCRDQVPCTDTVPTPSTESGLAESSSSVSNEGDKAEYTCTNATLKINGEDTFTLTCGSDGKFPSPMTWPTCSDPVEVFTEEPSEDCHCLGEIEDQVQARALLDQVCREGSLESAMGNTIGISMKRCGTTKLDAPTLENRCFCDSPLEQSKRGFWLKVVLATKPWQWTESTGQGSISYLSITDAPKFRELKSELEKAVDAKFFASGLSKFVRSALHRFMKGKEVPAGVFPEAKPVTEAPNLDNVPKGSECTGSLLVAVNVPPHLSRQGTGGIAIGSKAIFKCGSPNQVLFTVAGAAGRVFSAANELGLTCNADGTGFSDVPTSWPECRAITDQCPILEPASDSGMNSQASGTPPSNVGASLAFSCADGTHTVAGTDSDQYEVTCQVIGTDADPWYVAKFPDPSTWPKCEAPEVRRKRSTGGTGYNYIEVEMQVQFHDETVTKAAVQGVVDNLEGDLGDGLLLQTDCDPLVCRVEENPETCSNAFFENLPDGYRALTPFGFYQSPVNPILVDAGNLVKKGEVVELRCVSTDPIQYPLWDNKDHDAEDTKLTVTCLAPSKPGQRGSWSLPQVPKCASICREFLPEATFESDLLLQSVIPVKNATHLVDYQMYNKSSSFMYAGDKLMYVCQTEHWGINGGVDVAHDEFGCTGDGILNTPRGMAFKDPWPHCAPQQQMVIGAVGKMLDRFDRRISDRYKLIQFRETDNDREINQLSNFLMEVTLPVVLSVMLLIVVVCACSRPASPMCKLCESKV